MNSNVFITASETAPRAPKRTYTKRRPDPTTIIAIIKRGKLSVFSSDASAEVVAIDCHDKKFTNDQIDFKIGDLTDGLTNVFSN